MRSKFCLVPISIWVILVFTIGVLRPMSIIYEITFSILYIETWFVGADQLKSVGLFQQKETNNAICSEDKRGNARPSRGILKNTAYRTNFSISKQYTN